MAGQEGSNNNKCEALIPKFEYKRPHALTEMFPNTDSLFEPRVVSLGPVHHKKKKWQVSEKDKREIKDLVLEGKAKDLDSDDVMIFALKEAKTVYEGEVLYADFDEMMKLDACFIIHVIDYINEEKSKVLDKRPHLLPLILDDMFLLENQVPIIVLEAAMNVLGRDPKYINKFIEEIARSPESARTFRYSDLPWPLYSDLPWPFQFLVFLLLVLITPAILLVLLVVVLPLALLMLLVVCLPLMCLRCQKRCTKPQTNQDGSNENEESNEGKGTEKQPDLEQRTKPEGSNENEKSNEEECVEPSHLLDLLRAHLSRCSKKNQSTATDDNKRRPPRRATELTDAGIKFERSQTSFVKDVEFKEGVIHGHLFLPSLAHLTKTRLVNLMVYEFCQGVGGHGITSYVSFLDGLIDCPEDVKELRSTQILPKALGNDQEVANFFNNVGTVLAQFAYHDVLNEIEDHCQSRWRRSTAKFYDKHFGSPWTAVSFLIAILLFAVTIATAYKSLFG